MRSVEEGLDEEQFQRHKAALISDIIRPDKNIRERSEYYWRAIVRGQDDFAARQKLSEAVAALSLADWQVYFREHFIEQRRSLQAVSPGKWGEFPPATGKTYDSAETLRDEHPFFEVR